MLVMDAGAISASKKWWLALCLGIVSLGLRAQNYEVGHQSLTFVDAARNNREVAAEVYYPTDAAGEAVPLADGEFPCITVGHGFLMSPDAYVSWANRLVPEGFMVAVLGTETGFSPSHEDFGLDLAFVIDTLQGAGDDPNSFFSGHVAATSAIMGHSMGGGSSFLGMASAPNVTTMVVMAPAETTPSAVAAAGLMTAPALLITGSLDCIAPTAEHAALMYSALNSCKAHGDIAGASHCQFADDNFACNFGELTCPEPPVISRETQLTLQFSLAVPWLRHFLLGDPAGFTDFMFAMNNTDAINGTIDCSLTGTSSVLDAGVKIYPNPTENFVTVELPGFDAADISIYNVLGEKVLCQTIVSERSTIVLEGLSAGVYYYSVMKQGQHELQSGKLIKL